MLDTGGANARFVARNMMQDDPIDQIAGEGRSREINEALRSLLVAGDDLAWFEKASLALSEMGFDIALADTWQSVEEGASEQAFGVLLVDRDLIGSDHLELIAKFCEEKNRKGAPVVPVLAVDSVTADFALKAMRASIADIIEKPATPEKVVEAVQRALALRNKLTQRNLTERLASLGEDLERLSKLLHLTTAGNLPAAGSEQPGVLRHISPEIVKKHIHFETERRKLAGGDLFGDAAWTMMLELLLAKMENNMLSVSSACIGSGAPMSTAMRLVSRLVQEGKLVKVPDPNDKRRDFLMLSDSMEKLLLQYLRTIPVS